MTARVNRQRFIAVETFTIAEDDCLVRTYSIPVFEAGKILLGGFFIRLWVPILALI